MKCTDCGIKIRSHQQFCGNCGTPAPQEEPKGKTRSKPVVILSIALAVVSIIALVLTALLVKDLFRGPRWAHKAAKTAIPVLTEALENWYDEVNFECEPYSEIKNTRVIKIGDDLPQNKTVLHYLENVEYVVEFMVYTDAYGVGYYTEGIAPQTVLIYKDGTTSCMRGNLFRNIIAAAYKPEMMNDIIEESADLGDRYNQVIDLD